MENLTFELLLHRCQQLHLIRSRTGAAGESIASRHLDLLPSHYTVMAKPLPAQPFRMHWPCAAVAGSFSVSPQLVPILTAELSASTVTKLLHCPTHFLLHRSRLRRWELQPEQQWERQFGTWQHRIMGQFVVGSPRLPHLKDLPENARTEVKLTERIHAIALGIFPEEARQHYDVIHFLTFSLPRYVKTFVQWLHGLGLKPEHMHREWQLDQRQTWFFAGRARRFVGRIDALDNADGHLILADFKRSYTPAKRDLQTLQAPQLVIYAHLLRSQQSSQPSAVTAGYWDLRNGKWEPRLSSLLQEQDEEGLLGITKCSSLATHIEFLEQSFTAIEQQAQVSGTFPAIPLHCDHCQFQPACRKTDQRLLAAMDENLAAWPLAQVGSTP